MINGNSDSLTGIVSLSFVIYGEEESRFTSTEKTSMNISEHYVSKSVLWHSPQSSNGLLIQSNKDIIRVHITLSSQDELSGRVVAKVFYPTVFSTDEEFDSNLDSKTNEQRQHRVIGHEQKTL